MSQVLITPNGIVTDKITMGLKEILGVAQDLLVSGGNPKKIAEADDIVALLSGATEDALLQALTYVYVELQRRSLLNVQEIARTSEGISQAVAMAKSIIGDDTLITLAQAIKALAVHDIPFQAGWGGDGTGEDLEVRSYFGIVLTRDVTFYRDELRCEVAPTGSAAIVDIEVNGTTIYGTKPQIAIGTTVGTAGVLVDGVPYEASAGDLIEFLVTQVGSTIPGQKLTFGLAGGLR